MNYYGTWRTNKVKVKDVKRFKELAGMLEAEVPDPEFTGKYRVAGADLPTPSEAPISAEVKMLGSENGFNETYEDEDGNTTNILAELAKTLVEGEVLVIMEAGSEGMRYINGIAIALSWTGKSTSISLNDIYKQAAKKFKVSLGRINACEY
jgi:hypothetical protein